MLQVSLNWAIVSDGHAWAWHVCCDHLPFALRETGFVFEVELALIVEVILDQAVGGEIGFALTTWLVQMVTLAFRSEVIIVLVLRGGH